MVKNQKKLIVNIALYAIMPRIGSLLSLFTFPLITPYLTDKDFGLWGIISSYFAIILAISSLGMNVNIENSYYVYKTRFKVAWRIISGIMHVSGIICSFICAIILYFVLPDVEYKVLLVIVAATPIFLKNTYRMINQLFVLRENPLPLTYRRFAGALISVMLTYYMVAHLKLGYWGWVAGYFSNELLIWLSFVKVQYFEEKIYPATKISTQRLQKLLKVSVPLIPHAFALVILGSSDRIVMNFLGVDLEDIGKYSLGYRMANYVFTIIAAFIAALTPRLQSYYRGREFKKFERIVWISYFFVISIIVMGSLWMQELFIILVRNESLYDAATLGSIAIFAPSFHIWYFAMTVPLRINEVTKLLPWTILLPSVLNIVLNLIFIPIYGYQVALYTTFICYLTTPLVGLAFKTVRKHTFEAIPHYVRNIIFVTISNTILLIACRFFIELSIYIRGIISIGFVCAGIYSFHLFKRDKQR